MIAAARLVGASTFELSDMTGLSTSTISRRSDNASHRAKQNQQFSLVVDKIVKLYDANR
jgi:hypothetical protein